MELKAIVKSILKEQKRTLTWLAEQIGKTFDGLNLSLTKESIKFKDIKVMADALGVSPAVFFDRQKKPYKGLTDQSQALEPIVPNDYNDLKNNLKNCKEIVSALKEALKDKDTIISLMKKD